MHKHKDHNEIKQNSADNVADEENKADELSPEKEALDIQIDKGSIEKISALEEEVASLKDQYLRKLADYENFRKRMFREKEDAVKYANTQIMSDLIGVIDDFDRAISSSESSKDFTALHNGIEMIRKAL